MTIFLANGRLLRAGDQLTRDLGLTAARWQVLGATEHAPKTVAQIARDYELTRQGILWVVQSMVKDGVVELIPNPGHRRAMLVRQTARGRELYTEALRRQRHWSNELAARFRMNELSQALDTISRFSEGSIDGVPARFD